MFIDFLYISMIFYDFPWFSIFLWFSSKESHLFSQKKLAQPAGCCSRRQRRHPSPGSRRKGPKHWRNWCSHIDKDRWQILTDGNRWIKKNHVWICIYIYNYIYRIMILLNWIELDWIILKLAIREIVVFWGGPCPFQWGKSLYEKDPLVEMLRA